MQKDKKETMVQCSVKVESWNEFQGACKKLHINAAPYFCEILANELILIERTIRPNESRDKKLHTEQYFSERAREVSKIPMKKSLADNLNRISKNINIGRDAIIEEVLCLTLNLSNCKYNCEFKASVDISECISTAFSEAAEFDHHSNASLFSPLKLVQASLQSPRYYAINFYNGSKTTTEEYLPTEYRWYDNLGSLGDLEEDERAFETLIARNEALDDLKEKFKKYDLDLNSDLAQSMIKFFELNSALANSK